MTATKSKINWPSDAQDTAVTILPEHILFIQFRHDERSTNPLDDWDAMGKIYSRNRRHGNFREDVIELIQENPDAVALKYFEHGNCIWSVGRPAGTEGDWQWDGVDHAGVWLPDNELLKEAEGLTGIERRAKMVEWAGQACEVFTQWCNGEVYGYVVQLYRLRKDDSGEPYELLSDYRREKAFIDESCWNYFGWDSVEEGAREALTALKDLGIEYE